MSKGEPPPDPPVCAFVVDLAVFELVDAEVLLEVTVERVDPVIVFIDSAEVLVEAVVASDVVLVVAGFEVELAVTDMVDEACVVVVVASAEVELTNPSPPVTPALSVGIVTEFGFAVFDKAVVVFACDVVVTLANVGHSAP